MFDSRSRKAKVIQLAIHMRCRWHQKVTEQNNSE